MELNCNARKTLHKSYPEAPSWKKKKTSSYQSTVYISVCIKTWGHLEICADCCSVNKSRREAVRMYIDRWVDSEDLVQIYSGILFNHRKIGIFRKIDGSEKYIMQENPDS